jgi:ectoine hydroxylase-related dioxygenase (phytanoyl-CoA dioxygenase family)
MLYLEKVSNMLDKKQTDFFRKNGYLLWQRQLFNISEIEKLTGVFEEHLEDSGGKRSDELDTPHFRDARLFEFLMHPTVLDIVESLIGPDIGLWSSHFISKEPGKGRRTPWHEDSAYWKGKFDHLDGIVTLWLALSKSNLENGCMGVIPGTHTNGFSEYDKVDTEENTFGEEIKQENIDESKAVWFELQKGECSLHDARIIHGAGPNRSEIRRTGYTMRYFSLDMKFHPEKAPGHRIYHCRGENRADNPLEYL